MGRSVFLAGPHHNISNMQGDLDQVLEHWHVFIEMLKHVCRLCTRRYSKDRLIESCFTTPLFLRIYIPLLRSFSGHVYDKRWCTAASAVVQLINLRTGLRQGWNLRRYQAGSARPQGARGNDDEYACIIFTLIDNIRAVNSAVSQVGV